MKQKYRWKCPHPKCEEPLYNKVHSSAATEGDAIILLYAHILRAHGAWRDLAGKSTMECIFEVKINSTAAQNK